MPLVGAHTVGKVAHPNLKTAKPRWSKTTVAASCNDRSTGTFTKVAVSNYIAIGIVVHKIKKAIHKFWSRSVRLSKQISQMRVVN